MASTTTVKVGDWVAFMRNGEIIYARVQYVRRMDHYPWDQEAVTTAGAVDFGDVLECRRDAVSLGAKD